MHTLNRATAIAATLTAWLTIASLAQAQPARPVTAEAVIARHVAAIGGDAAIRALANRHVVMTMGIPSGARTRYEFWVKARDKVRSRSTVPGFGLVESGFDGTTAWSMSKATGPVILSAGEMRRLRTVASLDPAVREWTSLTLRGQRQIDGRSVYVIDATIDTFKVTQYFDVESGLLVAMDAGTARTSFRDYRRFGPVRVATLTVTRLPTGDSTITRLESVDHRAIADSVFRPPPAVRALMRGPPR